MEEEDAMDEDVVVGKDEEEGAGVAVSGAAVPVMGAAAGGWVVAAGVGEVRAAWIGQEKGGILACYKAGT